MNKKKITFIICVNNILYFEECRYYIDHLNIPDGYEIDVLAIQEADSMCAAYNLGMNSTDAKYKIYMHQDVCIRNVDFLNDILQIFKANEAIGMIGMLGGNHMPKTGVVYQAWDTGMVDCREPDMSYYLAFVSQRKQDTVVEAVDGLLIATQYDVPWREDLFSHFDFYDASQSFEMRKAGYQIVVPYQKVPWVIHDSSFPKLNHYNEARLICLKEYPEYLYAEGGCEFVYDEEWNRLSDELAVQIKYMMEQGDWEQVAAVIASYRTGKMRSSMLETLGIMSDIHEKQVEEGTKWRMFDCCGDWQEMYERYTQLRFLLRRMELNLPESEYKELVSAIKERKISYDVLLIVLLHAVVDKKVCVRKLVKYYEESGQTLYRKRAEILYERLKDKGLPYTYRKAGSK